MAKRKRLTPALLAGETGSNSAIEPVSTRPPIAHVAGEAAEHAAFVEVSRTLAEAREEGRLIQRLPLAEIATDHLVRDRVTFDGDDMAALCESLRARGQQVPVEVVELTGGGYGLISGLRRVMALREINASEVLALIRRPETSADAYLAMVEENEIRSGISFYERARLASEAGKLGLYPDPAAAIAALFGSASPAKRSKIGSFVRIHDVLGASLCFPAAIPERVGLALVSALDRDAEFAPRLIAELVSAPPQNAADERRILDMALANHASPKTAQAQALSRSRTAPASRASGIKIKAQVGKVVLSGDGVTETLCQDLQAWLADRPEMGG